MTPLTCKLCGGEIHRPRRAWRESLGWVSPDGAKSMTLAVQTGALAHEECINLAKAGIPITQIALFDEAAT